MQWRQGDLLIRKIDELPKGAREVKSRILAEGEATGHAHVLDRGQVYGRLGRLSREMDREEGSMALRELPITTRYFRLNERGTLSHQEHAPLSFEPGLYEVRRQRQFEPKGMHVHCD